MVEYSLLVLLGLAVGAFGTLIGAGGGFVLMPILLLAYPDRPPAVLTALSLAVVFFNAASGSWSYIGMRRVDFRSSLLFLLTGLPGAVAGALVVRYIPRQTFDLVFGLLLLASGLFVLLQTFGHTEHRRPPRTTFTRTLVDAEGVHHVYAYSPVLGMALSGIVGVVSSLLGIGGGIIHVPIMVNALGFPVHIATATSHFILAIMTLAATVVHVADGSLGWMEAPRLLTLATGAVIGAQAGAYVSGRIHGRWIMRALAVALALVGVRILAPAFI